jgi:transcriptional regulator with XRE-family HTH domain
MAKVQTAVQIPVQLALWAFAPNHSRHYAAMESHPPGGPRDREKARSVPEQGGSVGGRRLAAELRRLRERTGLTGEEASERLGWSGSKLSRIERHHIGVKQADLRKLLALYRVDDGHRDELLALASESRQKGLPQKAAARFPQVAAYVYAEAEAESVWNWEPQVVPGLLQTPEYARAVAELWPRMFPGPATETDRRVEARLLRQQLLTKDPPLELSFVIDESVLRRRFGDKTVMRQQLEHLAVASDRPNIEVRIYPLDWDCPPLGTGAFSYMQFPQVHEVPLHDIVSVELHEGSHYIEDEEQTYKYRVAFDYLRRQSLDPAQSRSLISTIASEVWT